MVSHPNNDAEWSPVPDRKHMRSESGCDEVSFVKCELIRSINRARLVHRLGTIDPATSCRVTEIIKTLLNH